MTLHFIRKSRLVSHLHCIPYKILTLNEYKYGYIRKHIHSMRYLYLAPLLILKKKILSPLKNVNKSNSNIFKTHKNCNLQKSVLYMYIFALMKIIEEFAINILSSKK